MKYLYYPGCSQKATSRKYEDSLLAVCKKLGVEFTEIDDWNCCGATSAISVNKTLSLALSARNLAMVEDQNLPVITPCPNCWMSLTRANKVYEYGALEAREKLGEALGAGGLKYDGTTEVRHLLDFFVNEVGIEKIKQHVCKPLSGLKIAPYYGCQITRPYGEGDDPLNPQNMEKLIEAVGGEIADFAYKQECCGGTLMVTQQGQAENMSFKILKNIDEANADLVLTGCGLCQTNLDVSSRHSKAALGTKFQPPIINIAELLESAFGIAKHPTVAPRASAPKDKPEQEAQTVA